MKKLIQHPIVMSKNEDDDDDETPGTQQNFRDKNGIYYIHGVIDGTLSTNIIAPLIADIETIKTLKVPRPIKIFITSIGGRVDYAFDLISIFEYAKQQGVEIHTIVTSHAQSSASLIASSGHKRFVGIRAFHMLHFARIWDYSTSPEMAERNGKHHTWLQEQLVSIYVRNSNKKLKPKKLTKDLQADHYMINGGEELIKKGLADVLF